MITHISGIRRCQVGRGRGGHDTLALTKVFSHSGCQRNRRHLAKQQSPFLLQRLLANTGWGEIQMKQPLSILSGNGALDAKTFPRRPKNQSTQLRHDYRAFIISGELPDKSGAAGACERAEVTPSLQVGLRSLCHREVDAENGNLSSD